MQLRSRHLLVLGGVGLALGATGVAVAGSGSGSTASDRSPRPGKVVREDRQAFLDDVAKRADVSAAKLRDAIGDLRQTAGPGLRHGGLMGGLGAAADYLGLQPRELLDQLRTKTLAEIAAGQNKTVDGLKQALHKAAATALDRARANGRITQQEEDAALKRLDESLDDVVNGRNPEITALAKALGIDRTKLANAIRDAKLAEVDKALADKRITQQEADRLKQRIQSGEHGLLGLGPLVGGGPGGRFGGGPGGRFGGPGHGGGRGDCPNGSGNGAARPNGADPGTGSDQARPTAFFS